MLAMDGFPTANHHMMQSQIGPQLMATPGLDTLAEGSQYHLQQLQRQQIMNGVSSVNSVNTALKHRERLSNGNIDGLTAARRESVSLSRPSGRGASNGQLVRRRISRACDQCNQLRTKCDGKSPCAHCLEFGLTCEYVRERKKRGKASRKDIAAQHDAVAAAASFGAGKGSSTKSDNENANDEMSQESTQSGPHHKVGLKRRRTSSEFVSPKLYPPHSDSVASQQLANGHPPPRSNVENHDTVRDGSTSDANSTDGSRNKAVMFEHQTAPKPRIPDVGMTDQGMPYAMGDYGTIDDYHRGLLHSGTTVSAENILHSDVTRMPSAIIQGGTVTGYGENAYNMPSPSSQNGLQAVQFRMGESPISGVFHGQSSVTGSPGWLALPSPSGALYSHIQQVPPSQHLRFPVLRPLLPHIQAIIPIGLACDLLELYFSSTSSAFMQPQSPYILGYVFRRRSFLRKHNPRMCSPALLASMLWVAAQTSESAFLTSPPSARGRICQKLLELTVGLLKPLIHAPSDSAPNYGANPVVNGVALGGFGVALPRQAHETEGGSPGASGALDDVATYIHLATVVSASEYKAASLRWWNAAWSLARELKLGRELSPDPELPHSDLNDGGADANGEDIGGQSANTALGQSQAPGTVSEEEREERRRIWWLLYTVDRHLALCYNRPLYLLDIECDDLLQPENDTIWQAGEYYPSENHAEASYFRRRGPSFECSSHSIFGYFLPLMTILGEIVDLNHARNHPRFGLRTRSVNEWDDRAAEICQQLEAYGRSLKNFEARNLAPQQAAEPKQPAGVTANGEITHHDGTSPSAQSVGTTNSGQQRMTEAALQTRIVVAYGTHLMHTLHILINGKWDPIALLDDNDLWISSQSFITATSHAVSAAEAINEIMEYDPDLSFMPFFFGIYLLQGSFLLLLIADKLQGEASPSVVKACETIVRAHEACVVTLNTEYQRNFRKVMRSALAQVRGRLVEDSGEQQLRRREVLALYRWTGDGTGLAL